MCLVVELCVSEMQPNNDENLPKLGKVTGRLLLESSVCVCVLGAFAWGVFISQANAPRCIAHPKPAL
jgi:hypothetical protein